MGCNAGPLASALEGEGVHGARIEGLSLWEERDGVPTLQLRARTAEFQPDTRKATLHDLELRFDLPEQGVSGGVLTAKRGHLDQTTRRLSLEENITLRDDKGRLLTASLATWFFDPRRLDVPGPAFARSAQGTARAGRATANLRGETLVLEGGVEAELLP